MFKHKARRRQLVTAGLIGVVAAIWVLARFLHIAAVLGGFVILCWLAWIAVGLVLDCRDAWAAAGRAILRRWIRARRRLRDLYRPSPMMQVLTAVIAIGCVAACGVTVVATVFLHEPKLPGMSIAGIIPITLLVVLGACECMRRFSGWMRIVWARATGKFAMAGLAAVLSVVAHILATWLVFEINPLDPRFLVDYIALLTVLLLPFLYIYAISILIALYIGVEWSVLFVLFILYSVADFLLNSAGLTQGRIEVLKSLVRRVVFGHRFASATAWRRTKRSIWLTSFRIGTMAFFLLGVLTIANRLFKYFAPATKSFLTSALVVTEYHRGPFGDTRIPGYYLSLGDNNFSVAYRGIRGLKFETVTCSDANLTSGRSDVRQTGSYVGETGVGNVVRH
jgi:hypothetical protein